MTRSPETVLVADLTGTSRHNAGLVSRFEPPVLRWFAARMPARVTPDHLTVVGCAGAVVYCLAYAASAGDRGWLWLASLGLVINWFGDSLDGTLARYRHIERPRYGFLLDNGVDVIQQVLLALGFALSGLIRSDLCFLALAAFFAMSILTLLRARVFGEFHLTYLGIGPTELRLIFIALNAAMVWFPPQPFTIAGWPLTYPDLLSLAWSCAMLAAFVVLLTQDATRLSALEPPRAPAGESHNDNSGG